MDAVDVVVVGAGAVGLACAARLAGPPRSLVVIERGERVGDETSARNSGVIHAGLYYESGSLKAQTCVEGRQRLYARCARERLPHRRTGKLVVAVEEAERSALEQLLARGLANGAGALRMLDARELAKLEPRVRGVAALLSPESGIVDAAALVQSYKREALARGAEIVLRTAVEGIKRDEHATSGLCVRTIDSSGERSTLRAQWVINAAGLGATTLAERAGLPIDALGYRMHPCKGDYFALASSLRGIVSRLVYPMPVQAGLGVHVTLDLAGELRAGPDTEYVTELRYDVDPNKAERFAAALQRYLPEVRVEHLRPDYAGIRPKLQGPGEPARDFVIAHEAEHGMPGLLSLIGIESPGLTASEAVAERVATIVEAG